MFAGKKFHFNKLQVKAGFGGLSYTWHSDLFGTKSVFGSARAQPYYDTASAPASLFWVSMAVQADAWDDWQGGDAGTPGAYLGGSPSTIYSVNWNGALHAFPFAELGFGSYCYVELENFEGWVTNTGVWYTQYDSAKFYKSDGTLLIALEGARSATSDTAINPSTIPLFNGTLDFDCSAGGNVSSGANDFAKCNGYSQVDVSGTGFVGWRAQLPDGSWFTPPVRWQDGHMGGAGDSWSPSMNVQGQMKTVYKICGTSTSLFDDHGHPYYLGNIWKTGGQPQTAIASSGRIIPCYANSIQRLSADGETPAYIYAMEQVRAKTSTSHRRPSHLPPDPDDPGPDIAFTEVYADHPSGAFLAKNAAATPETSIFAAGVYSTHHYEWSQDVQPAPGGLFYIRPASGGGIPDGGRFSFDPINPNEATSPPDLGVGAAAAPNSYTAIIGDYPIFPDLFDPTTDPVLPYLRSQDKWFYYANTRAFPAWSSFLPFQVSTIGGVQVSGPMHLSGDTTASWMIYDGETETWSFNYWGLRQQTWDLSIIPEGQRTEHRADQSYWPFCSRGLGGLLDEISGFRGSYWFGSAGSVWLKPEPVVQVLLGSDSAARWTFRDDGGDPVGGGIVVDRRYVFPVGADILEFDMTDWGNYPYGYLAICNRLAFASPTPLNSANVEGWTAQLVGEDGKVGHSIAHLPGIYYLKSGAANTKWSTSAPLHGDSYTATLGASDDTAIVYSGTTAQFVASGAKVAIQSGAKLQIKIVRTDPDEEAWLPTVTAVAATLDQMKVMPVSSRDALLMTQDGPSLLIGPQVFYDPLGDIILDVPATPVSVDGQMSAGDLGALYLSVFKAQKPSTDLTAFMATLFAKNVSGPTEWTLVKHFWSDPVTHTQLTAGLALGPSPVLVFNNSFRNVPPTMLTAEPIRTRFNWSGIGIPTNIHAINYGQVGYMTGNTRRYHIAPKEVTLIAPMGAPDGTAGTNVLVADPADTLSSWSPSYFLGRVSNDETQNYSFQYRGTEFFTDRPWFGLLFSGGLLDDTVTGLAYDVSRYLRHARLNANSSTGTLWLGVSPNGDPAAFYDIDSGIAASRGRLRFEDVGSKPKIGVLYDAGGGHLNFIATPNEGSSYGAPMTVSTSLATGGFSDYDESGNGTRHFFWQEGSSAPYTIYYAAYDKQLNLIKGPVATNLTCDLAPIAVRESWNKAAWRVGILFTNAGAPEWMQSADGVTFS